MKLKNTLARSNDSFFSILLSMNRITSLQFFSAVCVPVGVVVLVLDNVARLYLVT